ncbi:Integrase core domain-containing protein [Sulfitobacter brevis]|uniref:Integrase core domain-containing protein n=1 Tax=Sulfitobacter brevis TaxID=74348 RepID=A0A1I1UA12_9RHOB|nr:Integrase core domain-containing protein [Sulfitobacter brevis]
MRAGVTTEERDRIKALEREKRELRQANEILRKGEAFVRHWSEDNGRALILRPLSSFAMQTTAVQRDGTRPPTEAMIAFIHCPSGHCIAMSREGWQGFVYVAFASTHSQIASSGGGSHGPPKRTLFSPLGTLPPTALPGSGRQYLSIRYTERLAEAGIEPSVGSVGDSYDNALAETINGLYKTGLVRRQGSWRNMQDMEIPTLGWVDWFNNRRLLGPIGNIPPAEAEQNFYAQHDVLDMVA